MPRSTSRIGATLLARHGLGVDDLDDSPPRRMMCGTFNGTDIAGLHEIAKAVLLRSAFRPSSVRVDEFSLVSAQEGLRDYQKDCVLACVRGDELRSGVIVAPCGSGKTHIGAALASLAKTVIVLTPSVDSVKQWAAAIRERRRRVVAVVGAGDAPKGRDLVSGDVVIVMTHRRFVNADVVRAFGAELLIIDEVHHGVSAELRGRVDEVPRDCTVGLSASVVREDNELSHLPCLCGEELMRVSVQRLVSSGVIARVRCKTVRVLQEPCGEHVTSLAVRTRMSATNANKLRVLHEFLGTREQGDRTIVFVDDLWSLAHAKESMQALGVTGLVGPLTGRTSASERARMLVQFRDHGSVLFAGRVLDESWDARANAMVQLCTPWGSRRQFHQRIGRVQRPGPWPHSEAITVCCPMEMRYVQHRDAYIAEQGYEVHFECDERQSSSREDATRRLREIRAAKPEQ